MQKKHNLNDVKVFIGDIELKGFTDHNKEITFDEEITFEKVKKEMNPISLEFKITKKSLIRLKNWIDLEIAKEKYRRLIRFLFNMRG